MTTEEKTKTKAAIAELELKIRDLDSQKRVLQKALDEDAAQPPRFPPITGQTILDIHAKEEQERKNKEVKGWS